MIKTPAYAAASAKSPLAPFIIERRQPSAHEVLIDIFFAGFVIPTFIRPGTNGAVPFFRWFPDMKLSESCSKLVPE